MRCKRRAGLRASSRGSIPRNGGYCCPISHQHSPCGWRQYHTPIVEPVSLPCSLSSICASTICIHTLVFWPLLSMCPALRRYDDNGGCASGRTYGVPIASVECMYPRIPMLSSRRLTAQRVAMLAGPRARVHSHNIVQSAAIAMYPNAAGQLWLSRGTVIASWQPALDSPPATVFLHGICRSW